ncbi:MAG: hypothetical protein KJZ96_15555 [Rhodocyclaceae bacterium]|nr:hypothetical protein [Rhodocyclaceae bacterium]
MKAKERDLYKLAIEAVGMCAPTSTRIRNMLNKVLSCSEDIRLRTLAETLLQQHGLATHSPAIPIKEMSRCRETATEMVAHCRKQLDQIG